MVPRTALQQTKFFSVEAELSTFLLVKKVVKSGFPNTNKSERTIVAKMFFVAKTGLKNKKKFDFKNATINWLKLKNCNFWGLEIYVKQ